MTEYYRARGGVHGVWGECKACGSEEARRWRQEHPPEPYRESDPDQSKPCTRCGQEKPLIRFGRQARGKLGRAARCLDCQRRGYRERRAAREAADPRPEGMLTAREVAERLGVSSGRVRQLMARGQLPYTMWRNRNLVHPESLSGPGRKHRT